MHGWGVTGWGEAVVGVCWGAGWWHALFGPTVEMASALGAGSVCPSFGSSIGGPSSWGGMWGWSARRESGCGVSHREGLVPFLFSSRGVLGWPGRSFSVPLRGFRCAGFVVGVLALVLLGHVVLAFY